MTGIELQRGALIDVRFRKWDGGRHWEFPLTFLGQDEFGTWARGGSGTSLWRPGHSFESRFDWVTLIPDELPWCASFYDTPLNEVSVYVDMTTVPIWDGATVTIIDLDLDVILTRDGSLFVDDEDEFDAHRIELAYPDDVVELARTTAGDVFEAIADGAEPFAAVGAQWLAGVLADTSTVRR